jgi:hypothetical protein
MPTLHWLGREEAVTAAEHAPFRILEEEPDLSAGDACFRLPRSSGYFSISWRN